MGKVNVVFGLSATLILALAAGPTFADDSEFEIKAGTSKSSSSYSDKKLNRITKKAIPIFETAPEKDRSGKMEAAAGDGDAVGIEPDEKGPRNNNVRIKADDDASAPGAAARNYGKGNRNSIYHFSDRRVDTELMNDAPYRRAGKFIFQKQNNKWYSCTASLIKRSILVLAGHCVHRNNQWIKKGYYVPGANGNNRPYGYAWARWMKITKGWAADEDLGEGEDVALIVLRKRHGTTREMGQYTGYMGFCYSGCRWAYNHFTAIGYPGNYYGGDYMTEGNHLAKNAGKEYKFGSGMKGGSSGGPHVANLGYISDNDTHKGYYTNRNIVFAVRSWSPKEKDGSTLYEVAYSPALSGVNNHNDFKGMYNRACDVARSYHGNSSCNKL